MRVNNADMRRLVQRKEEFVNGNKTVLAEQRCFERGDVYVVFSYGYHFPMYVYDYRLGVWFANADKYSVTTSKHQNMCCPSHHTIKVDTHTMDKLAHGNFEDVGNELLHGMARAS